MLQTGEGAFYNRVLLVRLFLPVMQGDVEVAREVGADAERLMSTSVAEMVSGRGPAGNCEARVVAGQPGRAHARLMEAHGRAGTRSADGGAMGGDRRARGGGTRGARPQGRGSAAPRSGRAAGAACRHPRADRGGGSCQGVAARRRKASMPMPSGQPRRRSGSTPVCRCRSGPPAPGSRSVRCSAGHARRAPHARRSNPLLNFSRILGARIWVERSQAELGRVAARRPVWLAAHRDRAAGGRARGGGPDEPRNRGCAVHERPYGRSPHDTHLPDDRRAESDGVGASRSRWRRRRRGAGHPGFLRRLTAPDIGIPVISSRCPRIDDRLTGATHSEADRRIGANK